MQRSLLALGSCLGTMVLAGCGAPTPRAAGAGPAPAAEESRPAEDAEPATAEPITVFAAPGSTLLVYADLAAFRSLPGWDELRGVVEPALRGMTDFEALFADPALSPLQAADALSLGDDGVNLILTITYPSELDLDREASRLGLEWVTMYDYPAAALSARDDASVIARVGASRLVLAGPGSVHGALRNGPQTVEPFWRSGDVLAVDTSSNRILGPQYRRMRMLLRPISGGEVQLRLWMERAEPTAPPALDVRDARERLIALAPRESLAVAASALELSHDGSTAQVVVPFHATDLPLLARLLAERVRRRLTPPPGQ